MLPEPILFQLRVLAGFICERNHRMTRAPPQWQGC
jgi:hypothetical protein